MRIRVDKVGWECCAGVTSDKVRAEVQVREHMRQKCWLEFSPKIDKVKAGRRRHKTSGN